MWMVVTTLPLQPKAPLSLTQDRIGLEPPLLRSSLIFYPSPKNTLLLLGPFFAIFKSKLKSTTKQPDITRLFQCSIKTKQMTRFVCR